MTVHNHPPYRPMCNERTVDGQLRGACLSDDGTPVVKYLDPVRDEIDRLRAELALTNDTLRRRTRSHTALVVARLQCARCSTLPVEETPA